MFGINLTIQNWNDLHRLQCQRNNKLIKINIDDKTFCWKEGGLGKSLADQVIGRVFWPSWLQDQSNADDSDNDEGDDAYEGGNV